MRRVIRNLEVKENRSHTDLISSPTVSERCYLNNIVHCRNTILEVQIAKPIDYDTNPIDYRFVESVRLL